MFIGDLDYYFLGLVDVCGVFGDKFIVVVVCFGFVWNY